MKNNILKFTLILMVLIFYNVQACELECNTDDPTMQLFRPELTLKQAKQAIYEGIDINHIDNNGNTALAKNVFRGNLEIVKLLLALGADIKNDNLSGSALLIIASQRQNLKIAQLLLLAGANVNCREWTGMEHVTPL